MSNAESPDAEPDGRTGARIRTDDPIMEVRDVSVDFGMARGVAGVLNDVSVDIYRNEILGIVGESGSGKSIFASTLMDAVVEPGVTTGEITYYRDDGESVGVLDMNDDLLRMFRWEAVSMVFQGAMDSFNPVKTIGDHFSETIDAHNKDHDVVMERAERLLEDLKLETERILESYPHELSGGQKQRALIALSLILEPKVLVMDEPTAALDILMQRSIIDLLTDLKDEYGFTLVFITHDLPLVKELCDRIAVMYAFEFAEIGTTREVILNSRHPYTRALINATPNLDTPVEQMRPIEGSSPDPINVPTGCSYHPRCPLADQRCSEEDPELIEVDDDHRAACFYWDEVDDTVPLNLSGSQGESDADE